MCAAAWLPPCEATWNFRMGAASWKSRKAVYQSINRKFRGGIKMLQNTPRIRGMKDCHYVPLFTWFTSPLLLALLLPWAIRTTRVCRGSKTIPGPSGFDQRWEHGFGDMMWNIHEIIFNNLCIYTVYNLNSMILWYFWDHKFFWHSFSGYLYTCKSTGIYS